MQIAQFDFEWNFQKNISQVDPYIIEYSKKYTYLACCPKGGLRARSLARTQSTPRIPGWDRK